MSSSSPENMSAEDRRQSWFENELTGHMSAELDYGSEIIELLEGAFRKVESLIGKDVVAPHLFAMIDGPDIEGQSWEQAFVTYCPSVTLVWEGARLIDEAGIYGLYGVTPVEIPFGERGGWITALTERLTEFSRIVQPAPQGAIARIIDLVLSRNAIDSGQGDVDLPSLALFGGVSEGRIRNMLSGGEGGLERVGQRVSASSAAAWLKGRKDFFASIWQQPDAVPPTPADPDFSDEVLFVPVASDGTHFHPGLARSGGFTVGPKGAEVQYPTFTEALAALQRMATPRWRRPNEAGNWGTVSGRDWKRIERRHLLLK